MSLRIRIKLLLVVAACALCQESHATYWDIESPGTYAALYEGEALVAKEIAKQVADKTATATEVTGMTILTHRMKNWESNYNSYLSTGGNFASAIIGACDIFSQGVRTFVNLKEIAAGVQENPQGPFASLSMTNLYLEVGVELVDIYNLLDFAKRCGTSNLMSGAERAKLVWMVSDKIKTLNAKLHKLAISVSMYRFEDVWNQAIAGMIDKTHGDIAEEAFKRMKHAADGATTRYLSHRKG